MLELRTYQRQCVDAINHYMATTGGNPLAIVPTGGGKSLIMATHAKEAMTEYPGTRIMNLTSFPELIRQNYQEVLEIWPEAPAGIYSAKLGRRNMHAQYLFAGIQSIHRKGYNLEPIDIVQIDECHLISRKADTMYMRFLHDLKAINPAIKLVGYSATPYRMDSGMLHEGKHAMFDGIAYEINIRELMDDGYLCPLISRPATNQMDTTRVATNSGGDFIQIQLEAAATDPEAVKAIASEIAANAAGRRGIMVYCCGKDHAEMMRNALRENGIQAEMVFGDTLTAERNSLVNQFKARRVRCLVSVGVFTTGFNAKHVDMIALCRPTKSTGLYSQIVGRGTRLTCNTNHPTREARLAAIASSDKTECMVLDFGGNIARHGPIDKLAPARKKAKEDDTKGEMPTKPCPKCEVQCPISARECADCGFEFPPVVSIVTTAAANEDIMSRYDLAPEWIDVTRVAYARHVSQAGKISLRVTYQCGLMAYNEWVSIEGDGPARRRAMSWWRARAGEGAPDTVADALKMTGGLDIPQQIAIRPEGKYNAVVGYKGFNRALAGAA